MTRSLGFVFLISLIAVVANGAPVTVTAGLIAAGVDDGVGPVADVWALIATNHEDQGVNAIGVDYLASEFRVSQFIVETGGFLNPSDLDESTGLLQFRGAPITDSFVVIPNGFSPLAVATSFGPTQIKTSYTTAGGTLIEANSSATIAHLSVPTGETPFLPLVFGLVVYDDNVTTGPIGRIFPEPTSAVLVGLAFAGFAGRRRL